MIIHKEYQITTSALATTIYIVFVGVTSLCRKKTGKVRKKEGLNS